MIVVPFFNHYYANGGSAGVSIGEMFKPIGISVEERPCLCQQDLAVSSDIAFFHGARGVDGGCYESARRFMSEHPKIDFYTWAVNFEPCDSAVQILIGRDVRPPNCKVIRQDNIEMVIEELKRVTRSRVGSERLLLGVF